MKKIFMLLAALLAVSVVGFVSCSSDDDDDSSSSSNTSDDSSSSSNTPTESIAVGSKYKGTMTAGGRQTVYIIVTIDSASTWSSQGYDSTFTTKTDMGTTSGTYTVSGNTVSMTAPYMGTGTFTTSDNWNTLVGKSGWSGTVTRQ